MTYVTSRWRVRRKGSRSPEELPRSGKGQATWTGAGIGAGITGLVAIIANVRNTGANSGAVVGSVIVVWVILAIAALGAAYARRHRGRGHE